MAFTLTTLTQFVDEEKLGLIRSAILGGKTQKIVNVIPGIKNNATINILDAQPNFVLGGACGYTTSGSTPITQRTITTCSIKNNQTLDPEALDAYWLNKTMKPGNAGLDELPPVVEELFAEEMAAEISAYVDNLAWGGNSGGGAPTATGNLTLCDGYLKIINGNSSSVITGATRSNLTGATTIVAAIDTMIDNFLNDTDGMNVADADDLTIFIGYDLYRKYSNELAKTNLYQAQTGVAGDKWELYVPNSNVKMVAVRGLNDKDAAVMTRASNLYIGTDLTNDWEQFKFFQDDEECIRFVTKFKLGFQIAFLEQVCVSGEIGDPL